MMDTIICPNCTRGSRLIHMHITGSMTSWHPKTQPDSTILNSPTFIIMEGKCPQCGAIMRIQYNVVCYQKGVEKIQ